MNIAHSLAVQMKCKRGKPGRLKSCKIYQKSRKIFAAVQ